MKQGFITIFTLTIVAIILTASYHCRPIKKENNVLLRTDSSSQLEKLTFEVPDFVEVNGLKRISKCLNCSYSKFSNKSKFKELSENLINRDSIIDKAHNLLAEIWK